MAEKFDGQSKTEHQRKVDCNYRCARLRSSFECGSKYSTQTHASKQKRHLGQPNMLVMFTCDGTRSASSLVDPPWWIDTRANQLVHTLPLPSAVGDASARRTKQITRAPNASWIKNAPPGVCHAINNGNLLWWGKPKVHRATTTATLPMKPTCLALIVYRSNH